MTSPNSAAEMMIAVTMSPLMTPMASTRALSTPAEYRSNCRQIRGRTRNSKVSSRCSLAGPPRAKPSGPPGPHPRMKCRSTTAVETVCVSRMERAWERPWGWLVPGGAPWKLGRRHGANPPTRSSLCVLLVWDVWSERVYNRGRERTMAEEARAL
jgi:hypothetical protein